MALPPPIELFIDSGPAMNATHADFTVRAHSRIVDGSYVFGTGFGGGPFGVGSQTLVSAVVYSPGAANTYIANGTMYISPSGVTVLPDGSASVPSVSDYSLHVLAHPGPVTVAQAQSLLVNNAFNQSNADSLAVQSASVVAPMRAANLAQGSAYTFSVHGYDPSENFITTILTSGSTTVDPAIAGVAAAPKISEADLSFSVTDPDSATVLRAAVVPASAAAAPVRSALAAGTYAGPHLDTVVAPGSAVPAAHTAAGLSPGASYRVVAVAIDSVTSNVVHDSSATFSTAPAPSVSVHSPSKTYTSVSATSTHSFAMGNVDVVTAVVPDTPADIQAFLASNADPLSNLSTVSYPAAGTYSAAISASGLAQGGRYAAVSKAVPALQPAEYRSDHLAVATAQQPVISIGGPGFGYFDATVPFSVVDPDDTVTVYAAIHPAADPPSVARANLLALGSAAYSGAVVAVNRASFSNAVSRPDLVPNTAYNITVVAVESADNSLVTLRTVPFTTWATPSLSLSLRSFTDSGLVAAVASAGNEHDLLVYLTPYVVGNSAFYSAAAIAALPHSDSNLHVVPASSSNVSNSVAPAFSNLIEHTRYGIVAVLTHNGAVIAHDSIVAKTAALPDVSVTVTAVDYMSVGFGVVATDLDGPFRLLTAVAASPFSAADARAFAAAGMFYTGSGVVNGTQDDFPNNVSASNVSFAYSHSNLADDTSYVAVAVAVDGGSGIIQWAQQPFLTDLRPTVALSSVVATSYTVSAVAAVNERDGPRADIRYNVYPAGALLTAAFVAADPAAALLQSPGAGLRAEPLSVSGLSEGSSYLLAAVAVAPDGTVSLLAVAPFSTEPRPTVSLGITSVLARSLGTSISVHPNGAPAFDAAVGLFPHAAAVVNDALASDTILNTASNVIARDAILAQTAPVSRASAFTGLTPGDRITVLAAADRGDGDRDVSFVDSNVYLRVEPAVGTVGGVAVTSTTAASTVTLAYSDPDPSRSNSADVVAAVLASGDTNYAWMTAAAAANPSVPAAAVLVSPGAGALSAGYLASNLAPATDYDLVVVAEDSNLSQRFASVTPFRTRHPVSLQIALSSVTASSAAVDITAALPDGTFDVFLDVFPDPGTGAADPAWHAVTVASGATAGSNTSFHSGRHTLSPLISQRDYFAVAVAVDGASSERFAAHVPFRTGALPPSINIVNGSAVATSTGATLLAEARDTDSRFTCFAAAYARSNAPVVDAALAAATAANPQFTRSFNPSVANAPFPITVGGLAPGTQYRLVAVAQDSQTGSNVFDYEDFDTLLTQDYLDRLEYDNKYTLTWRRTAQYSMPVRGVQVSNGKTTFRTRLDDVLGYTDVAVAGSFDFNSYGGYTNNLVGAFDASGLSLFDHSLGSPAAFSLSNQSLNMQSAIVHSAGRFVHPSGCLDAELDTAALRQMPYCMLNMYSVTPDSNIDSLRLFQEMAAGQGMDGVRYDSATVYAPSLGASVPVFQGEAAVRGSSHGIAAATVYMFDSASLSNVTHTGFNTFRNLDRAFDSHLVRDLRAGTTYRWATLTAQATTSDFKRPADEILRLLLQTLSALAASPAANPYDVALRLRADHVSAWARVWATSATLEPKMGLTVADSADFYRVKRALRFAQFQLFGSVRDHGSTQLNPLHLSSLDADGNIFWNRELWVVPALLYFMPRAVRAMLEARFESLRDARTLAAAQGRQGAKFPYVGDVLTYGTASPYWDVASASYVFNTALVGYASWDYFRATHDRDWLVSRGYAMISAVADYVCSVASVDAATGVAGFPDVLDANGQRVTSPSFTLYICRGALKAAIESTYELRYPLRDAWVEVYSGLSVDFYPSDAELVRHHAASSTADDLALLEPLMLLQPHYVHDFLRGDLPRLVSTDHATLLRNVTHYSAAMTAAYADNPFNTLMRTALYAQINRTTGSYSAQINALVLKAVDDAEQDVWGAVSAAAGGDNDVSLSALLVLAFVTGFAGMHVSGGVAQSGFYYTPFGIRAHATTHLPKSWQSVVVTAAGNRTYNVINSALYP